MSTPVELAAIPYCSLPSPSTDLDITTRADGTLILRSCIPFEPPNGTICSYLPFWAETAPNHVFARAAKFGFGLANHHLS
jgi:hypothetical protein